MSAGRTCGSCGVYKRLHPHERCKGYRYSWWWRRHFLTKHVAVWLWIHALPSKARWAICLRMSSAPDGNGWRDWCHLVDCALKADEWTIWRSDYAGRWSCLCDFPMPWEVKAATYKGCYCCVPPMPVREVVA